MMLLLAASCQKDESADIDADGGQPSTEVSPRQLQDRAREIVNSEEYREFTDQSESFIDKIHDENFFTLELFDFDNETYNYDLINERLSGTSFESAEEFVQEYENMMRLGFEMGKKYPEIANESLQEKIEEEMLVMDEKRQKGRMMVRKDCASKFRCKASCASSKRNCEFPIKTTYISAVAVCSLLSPTLPAYGLCMGAATAAYAAAMYSCERNYKNCLSGCERIDCEYD